MCAEQALEDRAAKLQLEFGRVADDLRQEKENYRQAEALRKQLEVEIREITVKLEENEQYSSREGRRTAAKLATRVRYAMLLLSARSPTHSRVPHANDTTQRNFCLCEGA